MTEDNNTQLIAAIRIRGESGMIPQIKDTLQSLNLKNQHNLVFLKSTPNVIGMLKRAKDYITWGKVSAETVSEVETKKGKEVKIYRLNPPRGGFERKGIKQPFTTGGVLGDRKDAINALIQKML